MAFTGNASIITSHAALRLLSHSIDQTALVMSANTAPDGGGGTYVYVATDTSSGCTFIGSVSGTTLTVTSVTNGALAIGLSVNRSDTGATIGTITPGGTGTGGTGTYFLSASASISGPFAFTADNDSSFIVAVDGGRWFNVGYFQTAAEIATGLTPANYIYPPGNVLRYGVVPNSSIAASANAVILQRLFNASITNGPTGYFYFPNTTGADTYNIGAVGASCVITVRDGCTIDLNECTLNMAATGSATDANSGFWFAIRDFTLQNGTINTNLVAGTGVTSAGNCVQIGARQNNAPRWPISILDASLPVPMGNITLRNLRLNPAGSGINLGGIAAVAITGGVTNIVMENVVMTGTGNGGVQLGVTYEFGFATASVGGDSGSSTAQSSHMSGFRMCNCSVQNFENVLTTSTAVTLTGAFDVIIENFAFGGISNGITISTGECLNFRPWVGTQAQLGNDTGAKRNVKLVNIVGENFSGAGLTLAGATSRTTNSGYRQIGWVPGHSYVNGGGGSGTNLGMTVVNNVLGSLVGGTLYTNGSYPNVPLTLGSGSGMTANITVAGGSVTAVALTATGANYRAGNVLSCLTSNIGGGPGSGFTITVTAVNAYICTASGTSAAATGPTGTGTGITDNTVTWDYLPLTANSDLYDFSIDGLALTCGATAGGIATSAGHFDLRNGTISTPAGNNQSGIVLSDECTFFNLENLNVFGMGVEACRFDFGNLANNTWKPARPKKGTFKNCYFAGNGTSAAAGTFPAISIANCDGVTVDACRFGYETSYSAKSEASQGTGVNLSSATTVQNVLVKNCRFGGVAGGSPYAVQSIAGGTSNTNCRFENNTVGSGILNTAGAWLSDSVLTQTLVNGSTITNNGASGSYRTVHCSAAGAVTAIKLQPGVYGGQLLTLTNTAAGGGSITFDVVGNSSVAEGVSNPIATLTGRTFIWDSTAGLWYRSA